MLLSAKQLELLKTVSGKNADGSLVDLDQIIAAQSYPTNKPSIQFIIRSMVGKKLIIKDGTEVRSQRRKVLFNVTELGKRYVEWSTPKAAESVKEAIVE